MVSTSVSDHSRAATVAWPSSASEDQAASRWWCFSKAYADFEGAPRAASHCCLPRRWSARAIAEGNPGRWRSRRAAQAGTKAAQLAARRRAKTQRVIIDLFYDRRQIEGCSARQKVHGHVPVSLHHPSGSLARRRSPAAAPGHPAQRRVPCTSRSLCGRSAIHFALESLRSPRRFPLGKLSGRPGIVARIKQPGLSPPAPRAAPVVSAGEPVVDFGIDAAQRRRSALYSANDSANDSSMSVRP